MRKELGKKGEEIAEKYLKEKGYIIIQKNFFVHGGELDIVAKDKNQFVFVEVKTRRDKSFGEVIEQISYKQQKTLMRTAELYLAKRNLLDSLWRIDLIAILIENGKEIKIEHIINAVSPF